MKKDRQFMKKHDNYFAESVEAGTSFAAKVERRHYFLEIDEEAN